MIWRATMCYGSWLCRERHVVRREMPLVIYIHLLQQRHSSINSSSSGSLRHWHQWTRLWTCYNKAGQGLPEERTASRQLLFRQVYEEDNSIEEIFRYTSLWCSFFLLLQISYTIWLISLSGYLPNIGKIMVGAAYTSWENNTISNLKMFIYHTRASNPRHHHVF